MDANVDRNLVDALVGRDEVLKGALDFDGAAHGPGDAAERDHEPGALDVDFAAVMALKCVADDAVMLEEDPTGRLVTQSLRHAGVVDHVAEEDGDRAVLREGVGGSGRGRGRLEALPSGVRRVPHPGFGHAARCWRISLSARLSRSRSLPVGGPCRRSRIERDGR